jgi:hypothetical protein
MNGCYRAAGEDTEVVNSVDPLGVLEEMLLTLWFCLLLQVCAMRMPVDMLLQWLPQMMEGMLIWSDDSKNKFRLKVCRVVFLDGSSV